MRLFSQVQLALAVVDVTAQQTANPVLAAKMVQRAVVALGNAIKNPQRHKPKTKIP